jgi:hypothetical protein
MSAGVTDRRRSARSPVRSTGYYTLVVLDAGAPTRLGSSLLSLTSFDGVLSFRTFLTVSCVPVPDSLLIPLEGPGTSG